MKGTRTRRRQSATMIDWMKSNDVEYEHIKKQEAQLSLRNRAMLVCKEVWQDFLSEYVDKKFTYICYRRLIRHERIYYGSKNCVIYNSYSLHTCINCIFVFVSPGDAPATITQYVAWMERQFNACQTPCSMYLPIFNSFRVIRCLSQCVSPKIDILPHFFPLGTPLGQSR